MKSCWHCVVIRNGMTEFRLITSPGSVRHWCNHHHRSAEPTYQRRGCALEAKYIRRVIISRNSLDRFVFVLNRHFLVLVFFSDAVTVLYCLRGYSAARQSEIKSSGSISCSFLAHCGCCCCMQRVLPPKKPILNGWNGTRGLLYSLLRLKPPVITGNSKSVRVVDVDWRIALRCESVIGPSRISFHRLNNFIHPPVILLCFDQSELLCIKQNRVLWKDHLIYPTKRKYLAAITSLA